MDEKIMNPQPRFKSLAGRNLMEYTFEDTTQIYGYQIEMIANNPVPGLLKSEAIRIDGVVKLSFDITSLIPLQKVLERREISRDDFFRMLKQMADLIEAMEEYLLDSGGVIFDSRFIFMDPQDLRMGFAYLPIKEMPQDLEPLKNLLLHSIIHDIRFKSEPYDDFIQRLIELLKTEELKISTLKKYISDMETAHFQSAKSFDEMSLQRRAPVEEPPRQQSFKMPDEAKEEKPQKQEAPQDINKACFPAKSFIVSGSVLAAYLIFGLVLCFTGVLSANSPDFILSLFGYLIIGGALSYLLYTKFFTPDKKIQKTKPVVPAGQAANFMDKRPVIIPSKKVEYVNRSFRIPEPVFHKAREEAACVSPDSPQYQDRTVVLDGGSINHPYLKGVQGEIIILTHFPFMLGRLEEQVDYCIKNPAVGKLHAELKKTPEGFFTADMNSRNGTFINGERIEPNQDYRLENGSKITFANAEFVFCAGQDLPVE